MDSQQKKVVVIGGGFAGVHLIQQLAKDERFHITLVDRNNYNFFPPLIYQVSAGFLEPSNISYPFRKLYHHKKNITFRLGEFQRVVPEENKVIISTGELTYDYLILSTGTQSNFFGMENVRQKAVPMKTINDAIELRNYILQTIEKATVTTDAAERKKLLTMVVAGAGPSGVEISGILAEMKNGIYRKDYPELKGSGGEIYLVDSNAKVLGPMSTKSQDYTYESLQKLGIKILLGKQVKDYVDDQVIFADGGKIATKTLIWTAGVIAVEIPGLPKEVIGRGRRVMVDAHNLVQGSQNIYAIGDSSLMSTDPSFPNGHPQLAQVAIQQGRNLAKNLRNIADGKRQQEFSYYDKGTMAIIGKTKAVADIGKLHFKGLIAALIWGFIHIWSLINYRNKLKTFFNWSFAWFTKDVAMRFIFRPDKKL
ncbi:NAD(P)/FAD-dependent oxidoreductase [Paraflavitalea sp. CAU 1676]|uniref:NAD(P)/FAD-dependent oxidoreductase n=1 Tax=Paraflavitalea sp. CAU 1676 TaxID=3032598 RepID=UPI0023DAAB00|nr:NAD(P)/FAD-dependent oxidoreductase [Paraflavitalea sp. CAU 1676]MDF2192847.1 NAD(P)/FAD-dependent oxidoreductase [Paraflavitalea sp. CAU 1676]